MGSQNSSAREFSVGKRVMSSWVSRGPCHQGCTLRPSESHPATTEKNRGQEPEPL